MTTRKIESTPIFERDGNWIVQFFENDKCIGDVEVFKTYTSSGFADEAKVTTEEQDACEDHAVELYRAMIVERIRMKLQEMCPEYVVGVVPILMK